MSAVVAGLVALAVLVVAGPGPRPAARGSMGSGAGGGSGGRGRDVPRTSPGEWWRSASTRHARRAGQADLAGVLHAVAARVRAGVPPGAAWAGVLGGPVHEQVPSADVLAAAVRADGPQRARVRAVVAGAHVAAETGAPLADVLEQLAEAVAADAEQAAELEAALAGPRATARVLTGLPVLGLVVGGALGARPWEVLTDGGLGSTLGAAGLTAVVAGRAWVAALLRRAGAT